MNETLPKSLRIGRSFEIRRILTQGQKYTGNHIVLYRALFDPTTNNTFQTGPSSSSRVAFLSPKRIGKAVERNRVRRRLRELYRKHRSGICGSYHLILMGRTSAISASYQALTEDFLRLCRKARLITDT